MIPAKQPTHLRILVADDYGTTAESVAKLLMRWGHEVRTVTTGSDAMKVAGVFHPEVMLLDIAMPNPDGYEVAKQIRKEPWGKNVLLVALTGFGREEDRKRSREAGFNAHLLKPVWAADVKSLIDAYMSSASKANISGATQRNASLPIPRPN